MTTEQTTTNYKEQFIELLTLLQSTVTDSRVKSIGGTFSSFYPQSQFIRVDFLEKRDWPNNISQNSIYLDFKIDFATKKIEVFQCGHTWLTKEDQDASCMAMASMKNYTKAYSGRVKKASWFRSSTFKNFEDAVKKIQKFSMVQLDVMEWATGGYPYKKAVQNIYA